MTLIAEAVSHATQLGEPYKGDLVPAFLQAQEALSFSTAEDRQLGLILSAARMPINGAEKKTIRLIIGDEPITSQQMRHLVRLRLICAELIGLLTSALEIVRRSVARPGLQAQG
ncbi:MAG TPA: hypothetical protein VFF68_07760 [Anaerolineaceae bacterium]|nr:hypothetical protein [Anaerolineaceae bacterium]